MTTPERGLFERIKDSIDMHHCCSFPQQIEKICVEHEQRLAEAEANANFITIGGKQVEVTKQSVEQDIQRKVALIEQLRARCGELEGQIKAFEEVDAIPLDDCDEGYDKRYGRVLISTENCAQTLYRKAAATTPPPAQEQR